MKKSVLAVVATLALLAGALVPLTAAHAGAQSAAATGCGGESVRKKPGIAPAFRLGKQIHFGYAEWHFSPSCHDDVRRDYVKVYRVKKGTDPKVYSTTGNRAARAFTKGTYRVKVRWEYRYWNRTTGKHGPWRGITRNSTIRIR